MVRFTAHDDYREQIDNPNKYLNMLSNAFSQRRKKLSKVLKGFYGEEKISAFFAENGLSDNLRADHLPVETYVKLFNYLRNS